MGKVPTIKSSAQARLLLYRLFFLELTDAERRLLSTEPILWEKLILELDEALDGKIHTKDTEKVLADAFFYIDRSVREGLQKQVMHLTGQSLWLGVHATSLMDAFVEEHLRLIRSVRQEHLDKIGLAIKRGLREGRLLKDMTHDIRKMTMLSKRRAQLIARNAPLQYSGALTKHNQVNAGIKSYIWQSSRDERVRDSHRKFDGEIFDWNSAGPHPRTEVNCRCDAVPLVN